MKETALVFIAKGNTTFLFKRTDGMYGLLGGGIEENETPKQAAIRELQEEANVHCTNIHPLTKLNDNGKILYVFYCNDFPISKIKLKKDEHTSFTSIDIDKLINTKSNKMFHSNKIIAKIYKDKF